MRTVKVREYSELGWHARFWRISGVLERADNIYPTDVYPNVVTI